MKTPDGLLRREGERNGDLRVDTYIDQIEVKIWEPPIYILSIEQAMTLRDRLTRALEVIEGKKCADDAGIVPTEQAEQYWNCK